MADDRLLTRLKEVVEAYGASPDRWPVAEREALEAAAASDRDASFLADAMTLDSVLDMAPGAGLRAGLAADIVAAAVTAPQIDPDHVILLADRRYGHRSWKSPVAQGAILAASLAAGLWLGDAGFADAWLPDIQSTEFSALSAAGEDEANFLAAVDADELSL